MKAMKGLISKAKMIEMYICKYQFITVRYYNF